MTLPALAEADITIPDPPRSRGRVHDAFWQILAYRQDGLTEDADLARRHCVQAIDWHLRTSSYSAAVAGKEVVRQTQAARAEFAEDLLKGTVWHRRRRHQPVWPLLRYEVQWSFWQVLANEQDGLVAPAAEARRVFDRSTDQLRQALERFAGQGDTADAVIADQVHHARQLFAGDLWREQTQPAWFGFDWRGFRGRRWVR